MKLLISIKPEFVDKIISGEKKYEYRKNIFKKEVESIIIYACKPKGLIIGEFSISEIICESPEKIWKITKKFAGISYEAFLDYFGENKKAYAIGIKKLYLLEEPLDPFKYFKKFTPPQSYKYIELQLDSDFELK